MTASKIYPEIYFRQTSSDLVSFSAHRQEDGGNVGRQCSLPPHIDHDNIRRVHQNGTRSGGDAGGKHGGPGHPPSRWAGGRCMMVGSCVRGREEGKATCPFSTIA